MGWKSLHRWLGLSVGTLALVLGISGAMLAFDPVQQAWQAPAAPGALSVATLAQRVTSTITGAEEIRRLPSGAIVLFSFDGEQARASYIDPADGRVLGAWQPSALPRWVKNLHRSLLLGDAGRWAAAGVALAMALLCFSALVLLLRRMGGSRRLAARVRGSLAQRIHVLAGRVVLALLLLTSLTALTMSASTLGLVTLDAGNEPEVVSVVAGQTALPVAQIPLLQDLSVRDLRKLNFPATADPQDSWKLATRQGEGWIDRYSGQTLAWQDMTLAQRVTDWAVVLHTGEAAWPWAVVLAFVGASVLLFWWSGVVIWWQARRQAPRITGNAAMAKADVLIFVASEGGSTWGFAQALHDGLGQSGHRVHTCALEHFQTTAATRQVFVLAATHGEGQAPAHASHALQRMARLKAGSVPVTVLGFGDRQYPAFCAFAEALEQTLRARGWPALLPLECIHQQSGQQFARWGEELAQALGEPLALNHVPRVPATTTLTLVARQDYPGRDGQPTAILRFAWPAQGWRARLRGHGLARFAAGDLVGIVPPVAGRERQWIAPTKGCARVRGKARHAVHAGASASGATLHGALAHHGANGEAPRNRLRQHHHAACAASPGFGPLPLTRAAVPRYYSLASSWDDGFLEICVRLLPGGLCSTHLLGLRPGDHIAAFIRSNPGFALPRTRRPVLLIGAGTGVAPLAGFIRRNDRRIPMHLYFGGRDPSRDFYFGPEIARWLAEGRLARVQTVFSRAPEGGGYVQHALQRDAERLRALVAQGAIVRVCGSRAMARGVAETLDAVLAPLDLSVRQLKAKDRYAEDIF